MKHIAALATLILVSVSSVSVAVEDGRRARIVDVITAQLDAFARDDGVAAFTHAAPRIRALFVSPQRFLAMVARDYAPLYRPRAVTFLDLTDGAGGPVQRVLFTGAGGKQVTALYTMLRLADGRWRIAACVLLRPGEGSA